MAATLSRARRACRNQSQRRHRRRRRQGLAGQQLAGRRSGGNPRQHNPAGSSAAAESAARFASAARNFLPPFENRNRGAFPHSPPAHRWRWREKSATICTRNDQRADGRPGIPKESVRTTPTPSTGRRRARPILPAAIRHSQKKKFRNSERASRVLVQQNEAVDCHRQGRDQCRPEQHGQDVCAQIGGERLEAEIFKLERRQSGLDRREAQNRRAKCRAQRPG